MRPQEFRSYNRSTVIEPARTTFVVPAFVLAAEIWAASSNIIAEFPFANTDYSFSLKLPIVSFGSDFVAAVRYVTDDIVTRYKLFDHDDAVLYYPIYAGERLGLNAVLEIWSVDSLDDPTLGLDQTLESSVLVFPSIVTSCAGLCTQPAASQTLVQRVPVSMPPDAFCNPFCNNLCG